MQHNDAMTLFFAGVRQLCIGGSDSAAADWTKLLTSEGLAWCPDLTIADATLALPLILCASNLINIQVVPFSPALA